MKSALSKALLLPVVATCLAACADPGERRPHILLVTMDTLRWDYLNTYGFGEPDHTPAASRLAEAGAVFDTAVSTAGTTIPSHGSMLTGVYARVHGARSNFHGMYEGVPTVTEALLEAGYRTGAFVSNQFLINIGGFGVGFEVDNTPFRDPVRGGRPQPGDKTVDQAIEWLDSLGHDRPVFMWLHLWEPHGPYDATDWSRERLSGYAGFLADGVTLEHIRNRVADIVHSEEHLRAMRTHYAGEVRLADRHLGRLLDYMESAGWLKNTVAIYTADHGQSLGEENRMGHGPNLRETVIRVPMIITDFRAPRPGRYATRVSTIDVAPTIADAAGIDRAFDYAGRSLMQPESLKDDWPYFVEVAIRRETDRNWERTKDSTTYDPERLGVYAGPWKLTQYFGRYRLFETGYELLVAREVDLAGEPVMADYLSGLLETFQEIELDFGAGEVSEEDLHILQGLGYTQ